MRRERHILKGCLINYFRTYPEKAWIFPWPPDAQGFILAALVLVVGIGAHIRQQNLSSGSATSSTKGSSSIGTSSGKLASSDTLETATDYDESTHTCNLIRMSWILHLLPVQPIAELSCIQLKQPTVVHVPIVPAPLRFLQQPLHVLWILHFPIPTSAQRGIDEADIVKTDGSYLYTLKANSQEISIVDIQSDPDEGCFLHFAE